MSPENEQSPDSTNAESPSPSAQPENGAGESNGPQEETLASEAEAIAETPETRDRGTDAVEAEAASEAVADDRAAAEAETEPEPDAATDDAEANEAETAAAALSQPSADTPPPASDASQAVPETGPQRTTQLFWQAWNQFQPFLKRQTIRLLRLTIRLLERWLAALEGRPATDWDAPLTDPWLDEPGAEGAAASGTEGAAELPSPLVQRWQWVLARIRDRIPESLNRKLSDTALAAGLASLLVGAIALGSILLPGKPVAEEVTSQPPPTPTPVSPFAPAPTAKPAAKPAEPAPKPTPPPPPPNLKLKPEQDLIAAIQEQVAEVSDRYADGLIRSIQANFQSSRLIVQVGEGWYALTRKKQARLANEMLRRSRELDFSKLEMTDSEGTLLARSPVVGNSMIILQREEPIAAPSPSEAAEPSEVN